MLFSNISYRFSARVTYQAGTLLLAALVLAGCHRHEDAPAPQAAAVATPIPLSAMAEIGKKLFFDTSLSASGKQSCGSCHSPDHAFGPANDLAAQFGGPDLTLQGARAVPNLTYLQETPNFTIGPDRDGDGDLRFAVDTPHRGQGALAATPRRVTLARVAPTGAKSAGSAATRLALVPQGGFFWDGRANTLEGQAIGPLLNPLEMDNHSTDELVAKLARLSFIGDLKALAGFNVLKDKRLLLSEALFAIARFESEDRTFAAFDSKYDQYLAGKATLSDAEARGLKLFEDPDKGNCAACHLDKKTRDGRPPMFTDYQYEGLGVPRNAELKANADPHYYDLGICGPARTDAFAQQPGNCGLFKTPSLRNVATRHAFFHNGVYHKLEDVLRFYTERDTNPEKFYPKKADGSVDKFNDVPTKYRANIDVIDAPMNRKPGQQPALNDAEIRDLVAFLNTLTDGYSSTGPARTAAR